ncbi:hypothetical protein [Alkalimonas amylolytica]|uniref:Uncharacterized protein n=1 Tax=Alkalimonas amylolytica TaxID=152573 RepID=A0A1H3XI34_ALKAM|nr:hypothetical protein [Alkalimonas amylolytica]SDZ98218.1 hypothetical protein SAMN04488051_101229 [Alkalimonas amylolytica]
MAGFFGAPDYSRYSLASLIDAKKHLNAERYPERAKELDHWIAKRQEQSVAEKSSTQEIIWLKKPESAAQQKYWLYCSIAIIVLLPFFFTGNQVPSYSVLHSYYGEYHGIRQTYNRRGVVFYDLHVGDRKFRVAGTWQKLTELEPGTKIRVLSSGRYEVWEIRSGKEAIVSYSDFVQYADIKSSDNKKLALVLLIVAAFGVVLYFKLKNHNKSLKINLSREKPKD